MYSHYVPPSVSTLIFVAKAGKIWAFLSYPVALWLAVRMVVSENAYNSFLRTGTIGVTLGILNWLADIADHAGVAHVYPTAPLLLLIALALILRRLYALSWKQCAGVLVLDSVPRLLGLMVYLGGLQLIGAVFPSSGL